MRARPFLLFSSVNMGVEKIKSLDEIVQIRRQCRRGGRRLVFTNGCFDLLPVRGTCAT